MSGVPASSGASIRAPSRRLSQLFGEVGWWGPDPVDALQLVEPEVEDILRCLQDANLSQAATELEQRPAQDRHRQRHREVRVLAQRRNASRLGDQAENHGSQWFEAQGGVRQHIVACRHPGWRAVSEGSVPRAPSPCRMLEDSFRRVFPGRLRDEQRRAGLAVAVGIEKGCEPFEKCAARRLLLQCREEVLRMLAREQRREGRVGPDLRRQCLQGAVRLERPVVDAGEQGREAVFQAEDSEREPERGQAPARRAGNSGGGSP